MSIGVMPHLTVNQAMVLMDLYRGTFEFSRHLGTVQHDLKMLIDKEYINRESPGYVPTMLGEERVKMMLG
jgi:hypothetical protein